MTSIHYLLTADQPRGRLHRNRSDILHFLIDGGPVEYAIVAPDGALTRVMLGAEHERFCWCRAGIGRGRSWSGRLGRGWWPRW